MITEARKRFGVRRLDGAFLRGGLTPRLSRGLDGSSDGFNAKAQRRKKEIFKIISLCRCAVVSKEWLTPTTPREFVLNPPPITLRLCAFAFNPHPRNASG
jgi:hypothetical protein